MLLVIVVPGNNALWAGLAILPLWHFPGGLRHRATFRVGLATTSQSRKPKGPLITTQSGVGLKMWYLYFVYNEH